MINALELSDRLAARPAVYAPAAADLLRRQHAEIQEWRNVFGFLGTPDELGNEWNALKETNSRQHEAIKVLRDALTLFVQYDHLPREADAVTELSAYYDAIKASEQALEVTKEFTAPQPQQPAVDPVAWMVRNGVVDYQLMGSKSQADALTAEMQKRHDLSGSLASFRVHPLYTAPQPQQPAVEPVAEVLECGNLYAKVRLLGEAWGSTRVGDKFYAAPQQ